MIRNAPILAVCCLLLVGCVSKKRFVAAEAGFHIAEDSLKTALQMLNIQKDTLREALTFERGANHALLLTQDKLQNRLDLLQEEIDNLSNAASSKEQSLQSRLRQKDDEIANRQAKIDAANALLQARRDRLATLGQQVSNVADSLAPGWESRYVGSQLVLSFQEDLLFKTNSTSTLTKKGEELLMQIGAIVLQFPEMQLQVVGHTDNQPVGRAGLDNWQYSVLRAVTVVKFLTEAADVGANRVMAAGKGAFLPLESNETKEGKTRNRRIELWIAPRDSDLDRELRKVLSNE
ncbi:MAG: OmpA family protein [Saprospiraceae bacterium]